MIDGFRFAILGKSDFNVYYSMLIVFILAFLGLFYTIYLFKKGYKLKS